MACFYLYHMILFHQNFMYLDSNKQHRQWHPTPVLLPGKSHGWRSLVACSPWGRWGSDTTSLSLSRIGEGNGNPLQCSCLENPMDREAWKAAIHGVAQSRTRLKQLSKQHNLSQKKMSASLHWTPPSLHWTLPSPLHWNPPGEGNGNSLQSSCLENPMDRGVWRTPICGVTKSWTQLSN